MQAQHGAYLRTVLRSYGATDHEGGDTVDALWADCVVAAPGRRPLFERYNGKSALRSWLTAVAINRWLSAKRKEAVRTRSHGHLLASRQTRRPRDVLVDAELLAVLGKALREACAASEAEEMVILQLVHAHGLTRREVAALWGWHESRASRFLRAAERRIAESTLRTMGEYDPGLRLRWSDFLRLCESTNLLLF